MKNNSSILFFVATVFSVAVFFNSCSKDSSLASDSAVPADKQNVSLYLTDGPGFFDKVLIDIQSVKVLVDTCSEHRGSGHDTCRIWEGLAITPGVYDLLTLRNGTDTLLAGSTIPAGEISLIKIQLGTNNSLVKDSVTYPLNLRDSSIVLVDVKGKRWDEYKPRHFRLWMDFDIQHSIVVVRNNEFYLSPFIRIFTVNTTGSISGEVWPKDAYPVVTVYNNTDTSYALPSYDGDFKIRGLAPGTYNVSVNASNGYADTTITGIDVSANKETRLNDIKLHK